MPSPAAPSGRRRFFLLVVAWCALVAIGYGTLRHSSVAADLEGALIDLRYAARGPVEPSGDVVLVEIDDRTLRAFGEWPLPRSVMADAITILDAAGAQVIVLDLLFADQERALTAGGTGPGDQRLIDAIRASGRVVLAFAFSTDSVSTTAGGELIEPAAVGVVEIPPGEAAVSPLLPTGVVAPFPALASRAEGMGHVNVLLDGDGTLRQHIPVIRFGETYYVSLAVAAVREWLGVPRSEVRLRIGDALTIGDLRIPIEPDMTVGVDTYGPRGTLPTLSFLDLVEGSVDPAAVDRRIVVLGATATAVGDRYRSPYAASLPGATYFAAAIDNLISDRLIERGLAVNATDLVLIFVVGLLVALSERIRTPLLVMLLSVAVLGLLFVALQLAFALQQAALNALFPVLSWVGVTAGVATRRMTLEHRLRQSSEAQRRSMERYLPGLATVTSNGVRAATGLQPAGILFLDLQGYTALSEQLGPEASAELINRYYALVEQVVEEHDGLIDKFVGDGAMALFGVGRSRADEAATALACARALLDRIGAWARDVGSGSSGVAVRIGLHYGPVQISALGGSHLQVTAMGDTVNVASRLEQLTRSHGAAIITSSAVFEATRAAGRDDLLEGFRPLPDQRIRGRAEPMTLWLLPEERPEAGGSEPAAPNTRSPISRPPITRPA